MIARDVQQVVVHVVNQGGARGAAMRRQSLGRCGIRHGVALRRDDVRAIAQRLIGIGQHDVEVRGDRRMVQRLQQTGYRRRG